MLSFVGINGPFKARRRRRPKGVAVIIEIVEESRLREHLFTDRYLARTRLRRAALRWQ
jgi:hypothetical protein